MTARQRHPKRSSDQSCRMWPALRGADRSAYGPMSVDVPLWHVHARAVTVHPRADPNFLTRPVTPARAVADLPPGVRGGRPPSCDGWSTSASPPDARRILMTADTAMGTRGAAGEAAHRDTWGAAWRNHPLLVPHVCPTQQRADLAPRSLGANFLITLLKSGADARI